MKLTMNLNENSYPIIIEKNGLLNADKYFNLQRKVLIITDENVPVTYAYTIKEKCKEGYVVTLPSGEGTPLRTCSFSSMEEKLLNTGLFRIRRKVLRYVFTQMVVSQGSNSFAGLYFSIFFITFNQVS